MAMSLTEAVETIQELVEDHFPTMPVDVCRERAQMLLTRTAETAKVHLDDLEIEHIELNCYFGGNAHCLTVKTATKVTVSGAIEVTF